MMQLALPTFLLSGFLLAVATGYILRRWQQGVLLGCGASVAAFGLLLRQLPYDAPPFELPFLPVSLDFNAGIWEYGFRLQLIPRNEPVVTTILLLLGICLMLAAINEQGALFLPSALLFGAGSIGFALIVDAPVPPLFLMPVVLGILMAVSVFALQGRGRGVALGSLRVVIPPMLAAPLFLLAAWNLEQLPLNPQDTGLASDAAQLLGLGIFLLLAPAPLHGMQPQLGETSPPIATALTTLLYQTLVLQAAYQAAAVYPFLRDSAAFNLWLATLGTVTIVWGGVAAAGASNPGRLWGYAMLHDWGLILLLMAGADDRNRPMVITLFVLRILSTLSAAAGLAQMRRASGGLDIARLQGVGSRLPWSTTLFLLGSLGLAGFPLTAGFSGHWSALQALANDDWRFAAVVLISSGCVIIGFVRTIGVFFGRVQNQQLPRERPLGMAVALVAILIVAGVAILPQIFEGPIARALHALE